MRRSKLFSKLGDLATSYDKLRGGMHNSEIARKVVADEPGFVPRIADSSNREVYAETVDALKSAVFSLSIGMQDLALNVRLEQAAEAFEKYWKHYSNIPCCREEAKQWD